ncbi:MAG: AhpC/TSA family protein [Bacteroidales bacterium]|nr:AhpC/TSA family protein [Bacteroidales bacterium]
MKLKATVIILLSAMTYSALQAQIVKVSGKLSGTVQCSEMVINTVEGNKLVPIKTVVPKNGKYSFELENKEPRLLVIQFQPSQLTTHVIYEPKAKIEVDYVLDNSAKISRVKSSAEMKLYKEFIELSEPLSSLDREYQTASGEQRKALGDSLNMMVPVTFQKITDLISADKDKLFSALLVTFFDNDFENHATLYSQVRDALMGKYPNDPNVRYIDQKLKSALLAGTPAPDIEMKSPEGKILKLSDLRGKIVLLDFWASWCGPCRRENPNVVKLYHKYNNLGFEVFSVSLDRDRNAWLQAIKNDGLIWPNHVSDLNGWTSSGGATYGVTSIPTTVLIGKDGRIIAKNLRGNDLENKLREIFGQ